MSMTDILESWAPSGNSCLIHIRDPFAQGKQRSSTGPARKNGISQTLVGFESVKKGLRRVPKDEPVIHVRFAKVLQDSPEERPAQRLAAAELPPDVNHLFADEDSTRCVTWLPKLTNLNFDPRPLYIRSRYQTPTATSQLK